MALDPQLLDILACPDTHHAPLDYDPAAQTLTCTRCRLVFDVRDDIPILLLDEARPSPLEGARPSPLEGARPSPLDGARSGEGEAN